MVNVPQSGPLERGGGRLGDKDGPNKDGPKSPCRALAIS